MPALLIVAFTFLSGVSLYYINKLQGHARVINYTGIVRGATQQLVKQELRHIPDDPLIDRLDCIINELTGGTGKNNLVFLDDLFIKATCKSCKTTGKPSSQKSTMSAKAATHKNFTI